MGLTEMGNQAVRNDPKLEGLYLPCPQFPALDVIDAIERNLGIPAVGHLTSEVWFALKAIGVRKSVSGFGKLLTLV